MSATDELLTLIDAAADDTSQVLLRAASLRDWLVEARAMCAAALPPIAPPPAPPPTPPQPSPPPPVVSPPVVPSPTSPPPVSPPPPSPAPEAPAYSRRDSAGWTLLPVVTDARVIYVSSTEGKALNDGLSPLRPLNSIAAAGRLLRNNTADRLLLRRGDRFDASHGTLGNFALSGRSPAEPIMIGTYGEGDRPLLLLAEPLLNCPSGSGIANLAIVGLHLKAAGRDPSVANFDAAKAPWFQGIRLIKPVQNLLIEDCQIELFETNISISQGKDVIIRRCILTDAWATAAAYSGQGIYVEKTDGLLVEECLFDHNGWSELAPAASPNLYRHNLYVQSDTSGVIVRGNIIARAASHGVWMRSGGICSGNLFLDNAIHVQVAGERGVVEANLILGARDINAQTRRGHGITLYSRDGVARDNFLAGAPTLRPAAMPLGGYAIGTDVHAEFTPVGDQRAEIGGNTVIGWIGPAIDAERPPDELIVSANAVLQCPKQWPAVLLRKMPKRMTFSGNRYHFTQPQPDGGFRIASKDLGLAAWSGRCRETVSPVPAGTTLTTLPASLSVAALRDLLARSRARAAGVWNASDAAAVIVQGIRAAT